MSLRLSAALGTSPEFWLRMQIQHDFMASAAGQQPKVRPFPHTAKSRELALA